MEAFCIDKSIIGTEKHLIVDQGFSWTELVPSNVWHLSGEVKPLDDRCLDSLLKLSRHVVDIDPPKRFVNAMSSILSGSIHYPPPWQKVMPNTEHKTFVKRLVTDVDGIIYKCGLEYFEKAWVPGNRVMNSLRPAHVDLRAWQAIVDADQGNIPAVLSFAPGADGLASPVVYDRFGTRTGRLTVESGPQILTIKKEHRSILRSRYGDDGSIVMLDCRAMEARVVLYEAGKRCELLDMYSQLGEELNIERDTVKAIVISELYGSSRKALKERLGLDDDRLNHAIAMVKQHFNVNELRTKLKIEFTKTGAITNKYGRSVIINDPLDHIIFNSYVQSTGADVVMFVFNSVIEQFSDIVVPLFLIHDAIVLDVRNEHLSKLQSLLIKVPGFVQKFPLKLDVVSCTHPH